MGSAEAAATDTAYESSFSNLSRVDCVMITLPFDFDTTDAWRIIVRLVLGLLTLLVLLVFGAVIAHQLAAAAQLSLTLAVLGFICRRARAVPMGALGTITNSEVVARPVSVFGMALRVPNGRFPVERFHQIRVEQRLRSTGTQGLRAIGRVFLVGDGTVPDIEVVSTDRDAALAAARELSGLLHVECVTTGAPRVLRLRLP